jgi:exosome complex component RRP4
MRKVVIPGELLTTKRKKLGSNVYIENNKVYSSKLGILQESNDYISVIPLNGSYLPKEGDAVVGVIKSESLPGYGIDINCGMFDTFFPKSLLTKKLNIGDIIFAKIKKVDHSVDIDNINILPKGNILNVPSVKVPRIIGKNESMLKILKKYTNSNIVVGKNGRIWYVSQKPNLLEEAIKIIVENSQKSKLTNYIENFLKKN